VGRPENFELVEELALKMPGALEFILLIQNKIRSKGVWNDYAVYSRMIPIKIFQISFYCSLGTKSRNLGHHFRLQKYNLFE
jgi:hypothetical protein